MHISTPALSIALLALATGLAPAADVYEVDPVHTVALFKIKHLGVSHSRGRFNKISGKLSIEPGSAAPSSVEIEVQADSIDTADAKRDQHLRSPDFLGAKEFPIIAFKSKSVKKLTESTFEVTGDFTLHGVTRTITVKGEKVGEGKHPISGAALVGYDAVFTIKRSDHGMKGFIPGAGDEVEITISLEAGKK